MGLPGSFSRLSPLQQIVVVGAGLAGFRAATTLREEGYAGRLVLVGAEPELPYDRPPLSKDVLAGTAAPESALLVTAERLAAAEIEPLLGAPASGIDLAERAVLVGERRISYDGLILAPGASPRRLPHLEGRSGVHTLHTLAHARALREALATAEHVTVVGAGFIGSEVAATAHARGCEVVVVELDDAPLARVIGQEVGRGLRGLHARNGVDLRLGTTIEAIDEDGTLVLTGDSTLRTDVVVVGIGVTPNVGWLEGSGLELANGIVCDASLAAAPGVYAAGDAARWPNELFGRTQRVEHWTNAVQQAAHAARNLLHGAGEPFLGSNYVWSDQYGVRIQFAGIAVGEPEIVTGHVEEERFVGWYREGDRLVGVVGVGHPRLLAKSRQLIERRASWEDAYVALFPA